jgi:hypothetical protein
VPLRLAITTSGTAKGELTTDQILEIDGDARPCDAGAGRPSANAQLHLSKSRLSRRAAFGSIGQPGMIGRDFRPLGVDRGMFRWSASTATTR